MAKLPAFQFYPGDWLKDPALTLCTPAARGVWMDLICAMHESDRSGKLCGTPDQLARVARCSSVEFDHALSELQATGAADVTIRDGRVTVINRRMKREAEQRNGTKNRVRNHRRKEIPPGSNGSVTPLYSPSSSSSSIPPIVPLSGIEERTPFQKSVPAMYRAFGIDTPSHRDHEAMYVVWLELVQWKADVPELARRVARYRANHPGYPVTPKAILNNWHSLKADEKPGRPRHQTEPAENMTDAERMGWQP